MSAPRQFSLLARFLNSREVEQAASDPRVAAPQHFEFLDALRGLAALAVVVVHTLQNFDAGVLNGVLSWGAAGVQLFYIVSAYSLCLSLAGRVGKHGYFWRNYLLRRLFRIAPLFWLAVLVYLLRPWVLPMDFAPVDVHPPDWELMPWHVVATLFFVNGWHYQSINFIVPGGWSVAVESNFYLILPVLLLWASSLRRAVMLVVFSLGAAIVFRVVLYFFYTRLHPGSPPLAFGIFSGLWLPAQLPVFMLGLVMYRLVPKSSLQSPMTVARRRLWAPILFTAVAIGILWLAPVSLRRFASESFQWGLVLMGLAWLLAWWPTRLLVNPVTLFLGKVSYSLYLLHSLALHLVVWGSRTLFEPVVGHAPSFALAFTLVVALGAILAAVGYRWVEVPGQAVGRRLMSI